MKDKYAKRSRILGPRSCRYFAADLTALQAAAVSGLNRNTATESGGMALEARTLDGSRKSSSAAPETATHP